MEYTGNGINIDVSVNTNILKLAIVRMIAKEGEVHLSHIRQTLIKPLLTELEKNLGRTEIIFTLTDLQKEGIVEAENKIIRQATPEKTGLASQIYKLKGPE